MDVPPAFEYEAPTVQGTIKPHPKFNDGHIEDVIRNLQKAFNGLGTDEVAIIKILTQHSRDQRLKIKEKFKAAVGQAFEDCLKDELSGVFEELCQAMFLDLDKYNAQCLAEAMRSLGTNEDWLVEILVTLSGEELSRIRPLYEKLYEQSLEEDICHDTSGTFQKVMVSLLQGQRDNKETHELSQEEIRKDVDDLYNAGAGKLGTDEEVFNRIFALRSWAHLKAISEQYKEKTKKDLSIVIDAEFCFDEKKAFLAILKYAKDPMDYFTDRVAEALQEDANESLSRLLVAHSETDLQALKQKFRDTRGETLERAIQMETRGDYRKLLLAICNPPKIV
ncbi:hypothetical protein CAPTEDRAFT_159500, partial [Capitella teleta]